MTAASPVRHSIAARLTLGLVLISLAVFPAVGAFLYWALARQLETAERHEIEGKVNVVRHFLDEVRQPSDLSGLHHHLDDMLIGHERLRIWLVSDDGTLLYGGAKRPRTQDDAGDLVVWREDGVRLRGQSVDLQPGPVIPRVELLIGYDSRERYLLLADYRRTILAVCGVGLLLTIVLSVGVTRRGLRPIVRLSREASALTPDALAVRLDSNGIAMELGTLVDSFNRVLDRVETAYRQLEAFNADVAHELRTPLATAVTGLEIALARPRTNEELREALDESLHSLREIARMVNDMLFLARADRNLPLDDAQEIEVGRQSRIAAEALLPALSQRNLQLVVSGTAWASANPALVQRAVANLVANATRFALDGSTITLAIDQAGPWVRVAVRNLGESIPPELLPLVFERFVRGDASRSGEAHHGLGLAIVRAVARLHGGATFASSKEGVTEVGFSLPGIDFVDPITGSPR